MTIEIILVISVVAFLLNLFTFWLMRKNHYARHEMNHRLWSRVHYLEMALGYHDLVPMPWELDDFDEHIEEIKKFKQEGNVVYLQKQDNGSEIPEQQ